MSCGGCRNDSARHKYVPPVRSLITFGSGAGSATVKFRVPVPDSRLRVKISVLFVPDAGNAASSGVALSSSIWLYEAEDDQSGVSGMSLGATNIEGTQAAPTAIPAADPLLGYSREFVSAADAIEGVLASTAGGPMIGTWVLQVRYQPNAVRFTNEEWTEIRNQCSPTLITPRVVVP